MADTSVDAPPKPAPDWSEIRKAVVGGMTQRRAAQKFGVNYRTIATRSSREEWFAGPARKHAMKAVKAQARVAIEQHAKAIDSAVKAWTTSVFTGASTAMQRVKARLEGVEPEAGDLLNVVRALDTADRVGRRALGIPEVLSAQVVAGQINHVHSGLSRLIDEPEPGQVIDVPASPGDQSPTEPV